VDWQAAGLGGTQFRFDQHTEQSQLSACGWRTYWLRLFISGLQRLALFEAGTMAVGEVVATVAATEVATAVALVVTKVAGLAVRANLQAVLAEHQSGGSR
jgi:hypothetical protein